MKLIHIAATAALSLAALVAGAAETAQEAAIRKVIEPRLGEGVKVDSVVKTPYSGLYEVRAAGDIVYTDEKAKYLFVGRIIDTKTYQDYTKERIEEISKIKFSELPTEMAIKTVKGNGKRVIAIFEDPNCGYCKKFRQVLQEVDNVTIYTYLFNILAEDSAVKSKNVWCSTDRAKAWDDWMLHNKAPASAPASCMSTPNEKVLALGQKLRISGTPAIFFTDGSRVTGAMEAKQLEAKLANVKVQ